MLNFLNSLLSPHQYMPHGYCYLWQTKLVWLHVLSDAGTALAYYAISILLIYFARKRQDMPFQGIFILFGAFIILCGTSHLLEIWVLWHPAYWLLGAVKALTALVSLFTAVESLLLLPRALTLPNPAQLAATNETLKQQILERQQVEVALHRSASELQQAFEFEETLKRITEKVRDSLDEKQILQTVVQELALAIGVQRCNVALYDLERHISTVCYEYSLIASAFKPYTVQMFEFSEEYRQLLQGQYFQFSRNIASEEDRMTTLACPIADDQDILGDLWLSHSRSYTFSDRAIRLVRQVATQCAIALRQARLYEAAQAQVEELEKLSRLKDDFLSTVSHELRTPITNIKMAAQMLEINLHQSGNLNGNTSKINRYLQVLQNESQREISLINDLLDLSRLDAGTETLILEEVELQTWLPQVVKPFEERMRDQQQHLTTNLASPLPTLFTDPTHLERILSELLNNACKYTPAGETITVGAFPGKGSVQLSVCNSGVEIAEPEYDRIFGKFYRIPNGDPWKHGGTGLGLALVKRLAEHLGGQISVFSSSGKTQFVLELPLTPASLTHALQQTSTPSG